MIPVATVVEEIVRSTPFLEEGIAAGILNLSAVARRMRREVEQVLQKDVSDAAVMMALRRLAPRLSRAERPTVRLLRQIRDLTVRSNLVEFTYRTSPTLLERQRELLKAIARYRDVFVTATQGVYEMTLIASAAIGRRIEEAFQEEKLVSRLVDLSGIIIVLPIKAVEIPGVHYTLLKQLAMHGINVTEVVSTYSELTIVLGKDDVDRAFSVLKRFLWP